MKTIFTSMIAGLSLLLPLGITLAAEDVLVASEQDRAATVSTTSAFALLQNIPAEALNSQEMNQIQGKFFYIEVPEVLQGIGEDNQLASIDLQNALQKMQYETDSGTIRRIDWP